MIIIILITKITTNSQIHVIGCNAVSSQPVRQTHEDNQSATARRAAQVTLILDVQMLTNAPRIYHQTQTGPVALEQLVSIWSAAIRCADVSSYLLNKLNNLFNLLGKVDCRKIQVLWFLYSSDFFILHKYREKRSVYTKKQIFYSNKYHLRLLLANKVVRNQSYWQNLHLT